MNMKRIKVGDRVALSPACDLWMMGARHGVVRKVEKDACADFVTVRMDHPQVTRLVRLLAHSVRVTDDRGHHYGHCDGKPCTCGMSP